MSAPVFGALPGVTEFKMPPEKIPDAELSALLGERVAAADVIAIGETVHGSSAFLKLQARLIRYLVAKHGLRLIVWENPPLRSLELSRWLASCIEARSPAPVDVLYFPTAIRRAVARMDVRFQPFQPGQSDCLPRHGCVGPALGTLCAYPVPGHSCGDRSRAPQKHRDPLSCASSIDMGGGRRCF